MRRIANLCRRLLTGGLLWLSVAATNAADGAAMYADHCASCHGPDGHAHTPAGRKVHAKDLTLSTLPDGAIARQIREGKKDERGRSLMPAFRDVLSPQDIAALVATVKNLRKPAPPARAE